MKKKLTPEEELKILKTKIGMGMFLMGHYVQLPVNIIKDKKEGQNHLDSYFGQIKHFNWLSEESAYGSGFSPILDLLEKCKSKLGNKRLFDLLKRKTTYINLLYDELVYLEKRYDWKRLIGCEQIYLSKFETFITLCCEVLLILLNIYENKKLKKIKKKRFGKFESLLKEVEIENVSNYTSSINYILKMSLLIYLRNMMVHNPSKIFFKELKKQAPKLRVEINRDKYSKKMFLVVDNAFKLFYNGKKHINKEITLIDPRFSNFTFKFKLNKKANVDENSIKVYYDDFILKTAKDIRGSLFILEKDILKKMLA